MIKRIIGLLAALGVLVLVVLTAINAGSYTSILPATKSEGVAKTTTNAAAKVEKESPEQESEKADSLKDEVVKQK